MSHSFDALRERLRTFVRERDWAQFHSPKNLAICLSVEAGELLEHYTWTREGTGPHPPGCGTPDQSAVADEAADVLLSLLNFCEAAEVDLLSAAHAKLDRLATKYPLETARGSAVKHSESPSG
ncbi:MAG: nucleotide pyrophosphohydrolase [Myxococcota bacterium]|nr:nucleotide pyrophosphohydrolase [Myxococcota bacterium]